MFSCSFRGTAWILSLVLWSLLLLYLSLTPAPPSVENPLGWDKLLHAAALGGTAFLTAGICLTFRKTFHFSLVTGFISASLFGALIELLQWLFTVNRQAELLDLVADMIGAFFAMTILYLLKNNLPSLAGWADKWR
jgi:VanZ family protein